MLSCALIYVVVDRESVCLLLWIYFAFNIINFLNRDNPDKLNVKLAI